MPETILERMVDKNNNISFALTARTVVREFTEQELKERISELELQLAEDQALLTESLLLKEEL